MSIGAVLANVNFILDFQLGQIMQTCFNLVIIYVHTYIHTVYLITFYFSPPSIEEFVFKSISNLELALFVDWTFA